MLEPAEDGDGVRHEFIDEVLEAHNNCRKRHGVPDLELDTRLMKQSQECARDLANADDITSSRFPSVGENIYIIKTSDPAYSPKGEHPVSDWYQQKDVIPMGQDPSNNDAVNFSQLVWKSTKYLGVGMARKNDKIVIVCQYSPPGNINGQYKNNVLPEVPTE